jgi:hypothetical protein
MHRLARCTISVGLILALGLALASVALLPDFDPPGHYDGDDDDAGLIRSTLSQWADIPASVNCLPFIFLAPTECLAPSAPIRPQHVASDPLGSRAPPRSA